MNGKAKPFRTEQVIMFARKYQIVYSRGGSEDLLMICDTKSKELEKTLDWITWWSVYEYSSIHSAIDKRDFMKMDDNINEIYMDMTFVVKKLSQNSNRWETT